MRSFFAKLRFRVGRQTARLLLFLASIPLLYGVFSHLLWVPVISTSSDGSISFNPPLNTYGILVASFAAPFFVWLFGELLSSFTMFFKNHPYLSTFFAVLPLFARAVWGCFSTASSWANLYVQLRLSAMDAGGILLGSFVVLYLARCAFLPEPDSISRSPHGETSRHRTRKAVAAKI